MADESRDSVRYAHTNLVAKDWRRMVDFYVQVFQCVPVSSERDNQGQSFEMMPAIPAARARGQHLRLPGHGEQVPTLEVFQFDPLASDEPRRLNRPGLAHLAFEVPDIDSKRRELLEWGGRDLGELVTLDIAGAGKLTLIYMHDP